MNKARLLIVLFMVAMMVLSFFPGAALAETVEERVEFVINETTFTVNGEEDDMDVAPFIEHGRTFIPVRYIAEALGAEADYEPKDSTVETVTLDRQDRLVTISIGEYELIVLDKETGEEEPVRFEAAAQIVNGRTFLPFRAISEAFGADVGYETDEDDLVTKVWFTQEAPAEDPGPVSAENSSVTSEDQGDGSALVTLKILDEDGSGISGFGMEDIEITADPELENWVSLEYIAHNPDPPSILYFTDHEDGTYTYRVFREDGVIPVSFRVDGEIIETALEIEVTGMQELTGTIELPEKLRDMDGEYRVAVALDDSIPPENVAAVVGGEWQSGTETLEYTVIAPLGEVYILGVLFEGEPEPGVEPDLYTEPIEFEIIDGENVFDLKAEHFEQ